MSARGDCGDYPVPGDLLPHRPPMLLLRAVLSHAPGETSCEGYFDEAFAQYCGGEVPAAFALELIAQAAAVHHGLVKWTGNGEIERATRGLMLGSRKLDLRGRTLPVGQPLRVSVQGGGAPAGPGGLIRFEGRVEDDAGAVLASGDATVLEWRPDVRLA